MFVSPVSTSLPRTGISHTYHHHTQLFYKNSGDQIQVPIFASQALCGLGHLPSPFFSLQFSVWPLSGSVLHIREMLSFHIFQVPVKKRLCASSVGELKAVASLLLYFEHRARPLPLPSPQPLETQLVSESADSSLSEHKRKGL